MYSKPTKQVRFKVVAEWKSGDHYESGLFTHSDSALRCYDALKNNSAVQRVELQRYRITTVVEVVSGRG